MGTASIKSFIDDFWEVGYDRDDLRAYERYLKIVNLSKQGHTSASIERILRTNNVGKYLKGQKKSFLVNLKEWRERLGPPKKGFQWLPIRLKSRGTPDDEWIQVPTKIRDFQDIREVLQERAPTRDSYSIMAQFGYASRKKLLQDRENLLGFLLGAMLGDAGKHLASESRIPSMKVSMVLSKAKENSGQFGEFTSLCANAALGLRMHRIRNAPSSKSRFTKSECLQWITSVSPLCAWIVKVMMGLKRGETTTWNQLKADWLLDSPIGFRIHFLQGLAESDGWVNPGSDRVIIVATPNERLLGKLLDGLQVPHRIQKQKVNVIQFATTKGLELPIFNPMLHSNNFENLECMATARRFPERVPLPSWFLSQIEEIIANCLNYGRASLEIAMKTGFKISNQTVRKYVAARKREGVLVRPAIRARPARTSLS